MSRLDHLRRVAVAYALGRHSHINFWHERPAPESRALAEPRLFYPMTFADKAGYGGPFDPAGVPRLDYHGSIGLQYNPIAIAQFALAWMNRQLDGDAGAEERWRPSIEWLCQNLSPNDAGMAVWWHRFDWPYREVLRNPWYSGLAQGQGVSALLRAERITGDRRYGDAAGRAYRALATPIPQGGVLHLDEEGDPWIEEYLVTPPPSHILNGFLWALWGVEDMARLGGDPGAQGLFERCVATLVKNLARYDTGYWSLYEIRPSGMPMLASSFYHSLHLVQLDYTASLTGEATFAKTAERWRRYARSPFGRARATALKAVFKVLYY